MDMDAYEARMEANLNQLDVNTKHATADHVDVDDDDGDGDDSPRPSSARKRPHFKRYELDLDLDVEPGRGWDSDEDLPTNLLDGPAPAAAPPSVRVRKDHHVQTTTHIAANSSTIKRHSLLELPDVIPSPPPATPPSPEPMNFSPPEPEPQVSSQSVTGRRHFSLSNLQGTTANMWAVLRQSWPSDMGTPTSLSYTPLEQWPKVQPTAATTRSKPVFKPASAVHSKPHSQLSTPALKRLKSPAVRLPIVHSAAKRPAAAQKDDTSDDDLDDDSPVVVAKRSRPLLARQDSMPSSTSPTPQSHRRLKRKAAPAAPSPGIDVNDGSPLFAKPKRLISKAHEVNKTREVNKARDRQQARDFFMSQAEADETCYVDEEDDCYDSQDSFIDNGDAPATASAHSSASRSQRLDGPIGTQQMAAVYQQSLFSPEDDSIFRTRRNMFAPQGARFAFGKSTPPSAQRGNGDSADYGDPYSPKAARKAAPAATMPAAKAHVAAAAQPTTPFVLIGKIEMTNASDIVSHFRTKNISFAVVHLRAASFIISHRAAVLRMYKTDVTTWHTSDKWKSRIAQASATFQHVFLIIEKPRVKSKQLTSPHGSAAGEKLVESQAYYRGLARLGASRLLVLSSEDSKTTAGMMEQLIQSESKYLMPTCYRQLTRLPSLKQVGYCNG